MGGKKNLRKKAAGEHCRNTSKPNVETASEIHQNSKFTYVYKKLEGYTDRHDLSKTDQNFKSLFK